MEFAAKVRVPAGRNPNTVLTKIDDANMVILIINVKRCTECVPHVLSETLFPSVSNSRKEQS